MQELKDWYQWGEDRHESPAKFIQRNIGIPKRPRRPSHAEMLSLVEYFIPSRSRTMVTICDFGKSGSGTRTLKRTDVALGDMREGTPFIMTFQSIENKLLKL